MIRPLTVASFRLQKDENCMADVVINYGAIYRTFSNCIDNNLLVPNIERRWEDCEQPLFMLAFFLHPTYIETFLQMDDETELTSLSELCKIAIFYYQRFIGDDIGQLRMEVVQWRENGTHAYGVDKSSEFPTALDFWDFVKLAFKGSRLAPLALIILCVVINTATCERLFSELSQIHTARRNRLKAKKVKKISIVRQAVRKKNAKEDKNMSAEDSVGRIVEAMERKLIIAVDESLVEADMDLEGNDGDEKIEEEEPEPEEEPIDQVFFEWSTILGMGANPGVDDMEVDVVEEGQAARQPWPAQNVENWPQEPVGRKLTGVRGKKVSLEMLFSDRVRLPQGFE